MSSAWAFRLWRKVLRGPMKLQWDRRNDHMLLPQLNKFRVQSCSGKDHLHPAYGYRWISTQTRWKEEKNTSTKRSRWRMHLGWRMWIVSVVMAMMHGFATCCHSNQEKKNVDLSVVQKQPRRTPPQPQIPTEKQACSGKNDHTRRLKYQHHNHSLKQSWLPLWTYFLTTLGKWN